MPVGHHEETRYILFVLFIAHEHNGALTHLNPRDQEGKQALSNSPETSPQNHQKSVHVP